MDADVDRYLIQVQDEDWRIRWMAIKALIRIGDERAIKPLIEAMKHGGGELVLEGLISIGPPAFEPLLLVLKDNDWWVRANALLALGGIKDVRSIEPLQEALRDSDYRIRQYAAMSLGAMGDVQAVESLCQALKDDHEDVRQDAYTALNRIGNRATLSRDILSHSRLTAQQKLAALEALRQVQYRPRITAGRIGIVFAVSTRFRMPPIPRFCRECINDPQETEAVRNGAQELLDFLANKTLLRPSRRNEVTEKDELLRSTMPIETGIPAEQHLRSSDIPRQAE